MKLAGKSVAQQKGFTLIELIMVVVILGVLSAFALPRFGNFRGNATQAAAESVRGAVLTASEMAHSQWLLAGVAGNANITLEGGQVVTMINGYPTANNAGIVAALGRLDGFNAAAVNGVWTFTSAADADCTFTYTAAAVANGITTPPVVGATSAGCSN